MTPEQKSLIDAFTRVVVLQIRSDVQEACNLLTARIDETALKLRAEMAQRIAESETKSMLSFKGVYQRAIEYKRGQYVVHKGSLWCCTAHETRHTPGDGGSWQLCAKGAHA